MFPFIYLLLYSISHSALSFPSYLPFVTLSRVSPSLCLFVLPFSSFIVFCPLGLLPSSCFLLSLCSIKQVQIYFTSSLFAPLRLPQLLRSTGYEPHVLESEPGSRDRVGTTRAAVAWVGFFYYYFLPSLPPLPHTFSILPSPLFCFLDEK